MHGDPTAVNISLSHERPDVRHNRHVVAIVAAASIACHPHPGLGRITLVRGRAWHVIDLASCHERLVAAAPTAPPNVVSSADGRWRATVRASGKGPSAKQTIWVTDRRIGKSHAVFSETQAYKMIGPGETPGPIELLSWSGDDKWVFFVIDPGGSGSIAADGLTVRVVSAGGGHVHRIAKMLVYPDYLAWCGHRLVLTAGIDRVATHDKRLLVARPPRWRPRPLVSAPRRAWGALACAPDGRSVVAQSQAESTNPEFFATRWVLWQVGLNGAQRRLTRPARGFADESPRFSRDGRTLLFVRSRRGRGSLYALRSGRLRGPLLALGASLGYYGHQDWWQRMRWSLSATR
jgi:WD40-like Beta Propeller Repeat